MSEKNADCNEIPLIIKSGATDLRRSGRTLLDLVANHYPEGVKLNTPYFFCNKSRTTIKMAEKLSGGNYITVIRNSDVPVEWLPYVEKGNMGYTVEYRGEDRSKFLKETGFPSDI